MSTTNSISITISGNSNNNNLVLGSITSSIREDTFSTTNNQNFEATPIWHVTYQNLTGGTQNDTTTGGSDNIDNSNNDVEVIQ